MRSSSAAFCIALAATFPAFAQGCDDLKEQLSTREGLKKYLQQETNQDVRCAIALQTNGQTTSFCYAIFEYRSAPASDAFAHLKETLANCFAPFKQSVSGDVVNHPDSFDQMQYCTQNNDLSLSLKDKANLNQSLLFLRLDHRAPNTFPCK